MLPGMPKRERRARQGRRWTGTAFSRSPALALLAGAAFVLALASGAGATTRPADAELLQTFSDIHYGESHLTTAGEVGKAAYAVAAAKPCTNKGIQAQQLMLGRLMRVALSDGVNSLAKAILAKQKNPQYVASPAHVADLAALARAERALLAAQKEAAQSEQQLNALLRQLPQQAYCDGVIIAPDTKQAEVTKALEQLGLADEDSDLPDPAANPKQAADDIIGEAQSVEARSITRFAAVSIADQLYTQLDELSAKTASGKQIEVTATVNCNVYCLVAVYPKDAPKLLPGNGDTGLGVDESGFVTGTQTIKLSVVGHKSSKKR